MCVCVGDEWSCGGKQFTQQPPPHFPFLPGLATMYKKLGYMCQGSTVCVNRGDCVCVVMGCHVVMVELTAVDAIIDEELGGVAVGRRCRGWWWWRGKVIVGRRHVLERGLLCTVWVGGRCMCEGLCIYVW